MLINRTRKIIFKVLLSFSFLIIVMLLSAVMVNRSRRPGPDTDLGSSALRYHIVKEPQNLMYVKDLDGFISKAGDNCFIRNVWDLNIKRYYERISKRLPFVSPGRVLSDIFGNEVILYTDSEEEIYLITRTKIAGQIFLSAMIRYLRLTGKLNRENDFTVLKTNSSRYPSIFIKKKGPVLYLTTSSHRSSVFDVENYEFPYISTNCWTIYVKDFAMISEFIDINEDSPFYTLFKIQVDRRVTLLTCYFESEDFFIDVYASSMAYTQNSIEKSLEDFKSIKLDRHPLYLHINTPKTIEVVEDSLRYNEVVIAGFVKNSPNMVFQAPFDLIVSSPEVKGGFPVFKLAVEDIIGDVSFIERFSRLGGLPMRLYFEKQAVHFTLSNIKGISDILYDLRGLPYFGENQERLYLYADISKLYTAIWPLLQAGSITNPDMGRLISFLNMVFDIQKTAEVSFFTSKYEIIMSVRTKDLNKEIISQ